MKRRRISIRRFINLYIILFAVVTSIIITVFAYFFGLVTINNKYTYSYVQAAIQSFETSMGSLLKDCNLILMDLSYDSDLLKTMHSTEKVPGDKNEAIQNLLEKALTGYDQFRQISILSPSGEQYNYRLPQFREEPLLPGPTEEYLSGLSRRGLSLFDNCVYDKAGNPYLVFGRDSDAGRILLYLSEESVSRLYEYNTLKDSLIFLESNGHILSCSDKKYIGFRGDFLEGEEKRVFRAATGTYTRELSPPVLEQTLKLTYLQSERDLYNTTGRLNLFLVIALAVVVSICFVLIFFLSRRLLRNIDTLKGNLNLFSRDHTHVFQVGKESELEELEEQFVSMSERIRTLIRNIEIEKDEKMTAELKALQSQINPHFVYNSIDAISWMAKLKKPYQDIDTLACRLGLFFRLGLHDGDYIVTVGEELKHVETYLEIEKIRFPDLFEYRVNASPDLMDYRMLKITLQPLAENAVNHAFKGNDGKGLLLIRITDQGDKILFEVEDNGKGMDPMQLEKIKVKGADGGYGLGNVDQRLIMEYGSGSALHFKSELGKGTTVSFTIPKRKENPEGNADEYL